MGHRGKQTHLVSSIFSLRTKIEQVNVFCLVI